MPARGRRGTQPPVEPVLVRLSDEIFSHAKGRRHAECPEAFRYDSELHRLTRVISVPGGTAFESHLPARLVGAGGRPSQMALAAAYDYAWLRLPSKPPHSKTGKPIRCVDLFAGLGGMSIGVEEAARALNRPFELVWSADSYDIARAALQLNHTIVRGPFRFPIQSILDGELGAPLTRRELILRETIGPIDILVGGPPCQGHSNLNNHTRRKDPKNALYLRMARAVEVFSPTHVVIENVPGVEKDAGQVMDRTWDHLTRLDYAVDAAVLRAEELGVAQTRHRMFVVASCGTKPALNRMVEEMKVQPRPVEWAIQGLSAVPDIGFDSPAQRDPATQERIDWMFRKGKFNLPDEMRPDCHRLKKHRYTSVYGRMWKGKPASTITTGFMVMGQGRFVHPHEPRTLTPHEGARIQFLADGLQIPDKRRRDYGLLIGNAVPPKVAYAVALNLIRQTMMG